MQIGVLCTLLRKVVLNAERNNNLARETASRKYQLTINNPIDKGFSHEAIRMIVQRHLSCIYCCMADESGENGTLHTHIYLAFENAVMFSTIQKRFYGAHIESAHGTHQENRDYIQKNGKWLNDVKHGTSIEGTFEEIGELPEGRTARQKESVAIIEMLKDGASDYGILDAFPTAMNKLQHINNVRQAMLKEQYKKEFRRLTVNYLWGKTGVGKTRGVMEKYGYDKVYHVTNYKNPFDQYEGQSVILFDEFRSSLPIADMLKYLDGYPLMLPCRFNDRVACYTEVYVVSNIPMEKQYLDIQNYEPETWQAWLRRFNSVAEQLPIDYDNEWTGANEDV